MKELRRDSKSVFRLGYVPSLTGLRAFLLLGVTIDHGLFGTGYAHYVYGAWDMMSVFFVLSGFLITTLLLEEFDSTKKISLKHFWINRAFRLLPSVIVASIGVLIYSFFVHVFDKASRLYGEIEATLGYFQDYKYAFNHVPYFGFFDQTWSLSIEEQFYFSWVIILFFLVVYGKKIYALIAAFLGVIVSASWSLYLTLIKLSHFGDYGMYQRLYFAYDARAHALFLGCFFAIAFSMWPQLRGSRFMKKLTKVCFIPSVLLILAILPLYDVNNKEVYLWALPATEIASLIIILYLVLEPHSIVSKFLGLAPVVLIGNITYSAYIFHWPIDLMINFSGFKYSVFVLLAARISLTLVLALISWKVMEEPIAKLRKSRRVGIIDLNKEKLSNQNVEVAEQGYALA